MTTSITVSVPATSANLGPGFDCLGLAVDLWNQAEFSLGETFQLDIEGYGADTLPSTEQNLIVQAAHALYQHLHLTPPAGFNIRCRNAFPPGSGLGSSSSAILLGLIGANALLNFPLSSEHLLSLANTLEGHPDNVTPALLGGLTVSAVKDGQVIARKIPTAPVSLALAIPFFDLSTHASRAALPKHIPLADAVFNLGRTALVVEALRAGNLDLLGQVMDDRLHQPFRLPLFPGVREAFDAARGAGAAAVAISGAGPGAIAFTDNEQTAQNSVTAMEAAFYAVGLTCWGCVTRVSEEGAKWVVV